jgi:hypothetical protein
MLAAPMARQQTKKLAAVTTGSAGTTGIPCAMVLTVSFVLSPGTGLSCPRYRADRSARLDTSVGMPGPHDFAVRIGIARPARPTRPSHPRLTFGDDWPKRPLHRGGIAREDHVLPKNGREIFLENRNIRFAVE